MNVKTQKRLAADVLKCSKKRVRLDNSKLSEIKESITKADLRGLIIDGTISKLQKKGSSRIRARKIKLQKTKGRQKGHGSRKGKKGARTSSKKVWINKVRKQREFLKSLKLKGMLSSEIYRQLYMKIKGGYFRSLRHLKLFITEKEIVKSSNKEKKQEKTDIEK